MIKEQSIQSGLVFTDPNDKIAGVYYRILEAKEAGGLVAERVTTTIGSERRHFDADALARLLPVPQDPFIDTELSPLVGKKIRVDTKFGSNSGVVVGLLNHTVDFCGKDLSLDYGVVLSGNEEYKLSEISRIEVIG